MAEETGYCLLYAGFVVMMTRLAGRAVVAVELGEVLELTQAI